MELEKNEENWNKIESCNWNMFPSYQLFVNLFVNVMSSVFVGLKFTFHFLAHWEILIMSEVKYHVKFAITQNYSRCKTLHTFAVCGKFHSHLHMTTNFRQILRYCDCIGPGPTF